MFSAFGSAFVQFFSMFTTLFSAGNKFAGAIDSLAEVANATAAQYADEAAAKRQQQLAQLKHNSKKQEQELAADQT